MSKSTAEKIVKKETAGKESLVIIFGSQISGHLNTRSDFDIAVLADQPLTLAQKTDWSYKLSKKLGINEDKIDLIDLQTASPLLKYEVAKTGEIIEGDELDFRRFKISTWKEYQSTAKFRRLREQVIRNYV